VTTSISNPLSPAPASPSPTAGPAAGPPRRSITEFLTDGSLAALCEELTRLLGVRVDLRDTTGRRIVSPAAGQWEVASAPEADNPVVSIPLTIGAERIGSITLGDGQPVASPDARQRVESALSLLSGTVSELCQNEVELRHRLKEIDALTKMSSLLVRAAGPERVLQVALDSALDVLEMDAGSIVLFREDPDGTIASTEEDVLLKAHRGLSRRWLDNPVPLSRDRLFDQLVCEGKTVVSEDLLLDPRIGIVEEARAEGLRAALQTGLTFRDRTLGVIRLYSRRPRGFDELEKRLFNSLAHQAAAALEQSRLARIEQEELRVQRQLQLAADVQRRMLPAGVPSLPQIDVAARYVPSFELGGDFYDFIELSGHLGIVIGDVVGKGIAAALLMSAVRASLRAHVQGVYDLDEVVARVNQALCRDMRDHEFASLWYGVVDLDRMRLTYCSAGHEPPLVIRVPGHRPPSPADLDELNVGGMVVGVDPSQRYERAVFDLQPRDVLVGYTDGLVDAVNFSGERFGKKRLRESLLRLLAEEPDARADRIIERVLWDLRQFSGLANRPDDRTLVVARIPAKR